MSTLNEDRLTRIEEKVDKLSDAIISIARAEEKLIQLGTLTDVLFKKIEDMNSRMMEMERSVAETKAFMNGFNKITWVFVSGLLTAVAAAVVYKLWG
jgi:phosphoglycerate-specific signal transduction histidine kinase